MIGVCTLASLPNGVAGVSQTICNAVMPGFRGRQLDAVDPGLVKSGSTWTVAGFAVEMRPIAKRVDNELAATVPPEPAFPHRIAPIEHAGL